MLVNKDFLTWLLIGLPAVLPVLPTNEMPGLELFIN